jgi:biotin-(acetyl-CoA carboxylase) ligase
MADAIEQTTGLAVQIKWPNDLHSHGRKLAGILIETWN